jgi:hypothetical protein
MIKPLSSLPPRLEATLFDVEVGRFRYSIWRNVSIGVWAGQANLEAVQRVALISHHMLKQHPEGHSSVVFVLPGAPAPTPEAQVAFSRVFDPRNTDLACTAIVVEGEGFWASGIRSSITRMRLGAPGTVKLRVHDTLAEVLEWFPIQHAKCTGVTLDRAQLKRVLLLARALEATCEEPAQEVYSLPPSE